MSRARDEVTAAFQMGVAAADPALAVGRGLEAPPAWPTAPGHAHVIAFGKAAPRMAVAALEVLERAGCPLGEVLAVTHHENASPPGIPADALEILGAGHPVPDAAGESAARRVEAIARSASENDLVIVLVSGGGSALLPAPAPGLTLEDKAGATSALLLSGADIGELNCVRKHLSRLKGGGLARAIAPARFHASLLSDVIGDDPSVIASGPTVPDPTTHADALEIVRRRGVEKEIGATVLDHLERGARGLVPETPGPDDEAFARGQTLVVGGNRQSVLAAGSHLAKQAPGCYTEIAEPICGVAREEAGRLLARAMVVRERHPGEPVALAGGGETTVKVTGSGRGGRNQELALAFALAAEEAGFGGSWAFLSGGTDGRDGPTDAAGGRVDAGTLTRIRDRGLDPRALLDANDSYRALEAAGDLLVTGPTGTNVADLQLFGDFG